jgi:hypothetical protein
MNMKRMIHFAALVVLIGVATVTADVPQKMNYQGRLTDNLGDPVTTTVSMTFTIYDAETVGESIWSEIHPSVSVVDGLFDVILGEGTPAVPIHDTVFSGDDRWLEITVGGEKITPRVQLITVPYAMRVAAVHSSEILNEAGIASAMSSTDIELNRTEMTDIETVSIVIPSSGYILVQGQCYVNSSASTMWNYIYVQIDETGGGSYTDPYYTRAGMGSFPSEDNHSFPVFVQRIYYKPAGTYIFRMEGMSSGYFHTSEACGETMTALYVPSGYGPISSYVSDPAGFENAVPVEMTVDNEDTTVTKTLYEVDLRELELKAARLKAAALEAERELREAQMQQNLNDQSE